MSQPTTARPIVLVGLMGSGKTTVGRLLGAALDRPFRDGDALLEARYGQSAAEQAATFGADVLHDREASVVREAVADPDAPVIAAAASVVEYPDVRAALQPAYVVWLDAPSRVLADRMRDGAHRPHYDPDLEKMLAEQHGRRAPWFREVADLVVDVAEPAPEQVARTILTAVGRDAPQAAG